MLKRTCEIIIVLIEVKMFNHNHVQQQVTSVKRKFFIMFFGTMDSEF